MRAVHSSRPVGRCKGHPAPFAEILSPRKSGGDSGLDRLLADPLLCGTAKTVAIALVRHWAWSKDYCWPTDATIAAKVGRSVGHVQRCLRQLEDAGYIAREQTDDVPNGRRIWLNWRRAGAQPVPAPARSDPSAPARSEEIVIVNEIIETEDREVLERLRPESPSPELCPKPEAVPAEDAPIPVPVPRPEPAAAPSPMARPESLAAEGAPAPEPQARGPQRSEKPTASMATPGRFSRAKLAAAAAATSDPILIRELARLTAPPSPPEPPPQLLPTAELLSRLPGRHDLVMAAARRLCVETGDEKSATLRTFEGMCRAVASRAVPPEVLTGCRRQALGPQSRERGKVLVAAWKRESVAPGRGQFSG